MRKDGGGAVKGNEKWANEVDSVRLENGNKKHNDGNRGHRWRGSVSVGTRSRTWKWCCEGQKCQVRVENTWLCAVAQWKNVLIWMKTALQWVRFWLIRLDWKLAYTFAETHNFTHGNVPFAHDNLLDRVGHRLHVIVRHKHSLAHTVGACIFQKTNQADINGLHDDGDDGVSAPTDEREMRVCVAHALVTVPFKLFSAPTTCLCGIQFFSHSHFAIKSLILFPSWIASMADSRAGTLLCYLWFDVGGGCYPNLVFSLLSRFPISGKLNDVSQKGSKLSTVPCVVRALFE